MTTTVPSEMPLSRAGDAEQLAQMQQRNQPVAHLHHARPALHGVHLLGQRPQRLADREGRHHEALGADTEQDEQDGRNQ